jgi:glyoxylase-like metal-dependent hydrolase (beta-lactamase superfamily II)
MRDVCRRPSISRVAVACALVAVFACGCDEDRGVPRIDPDLRNWDTPYEGKAGVRLHVFNTGSMLVPEAAVFRGGNWFVRRRLDVPAFVIETSNSDLVVFDTGLSDEIRTNRFGYLGLVGSMLNRVDMPATGALPVQMKAAGLDPGRVRYVVLSHLHFDHTGSIRAFPGATVVTARGEKDEALATSGFMDFFREQDFNGAARWTEIDYSAGEPFATFLSHHDLLGDGAMILVDLHGHTRGSQGMLLRAPQGPILLTGDAAWVDESWVYAGTPISADDMEAWWEQIWRIKKMAQVVPQLLVVAGHDVSRVVKQNRPDVMVHDFPR